MDILETVRKGYHQQGAAYEAYRPGYSDETVDFVLDMVRKVEIPSQQENTIKYDIVELGAGTGKFSRKLLSKIKQEKFLVTEPLVGFLETLKEQSPGVESLQCAANDIALPDNSVKVFICAQCFHWFANKKSLTEINRVLVPNGHLVLVWSLPDGNVPWVRELLTLLTNNMKGNQPANLFNGTWSDVFKEFNNFKLIEDKKLDDDSVGGTVKYLVDMFSTYSFIKSMETDENSRVLSEIGHLIEKHNPTSSYVNFPNYFHVVCYKKTME